MIFILINFYDKLIIIKLNTIDRSLTVISYHNVTCDMWTNAFYYKINSIKSYDIKKKKITVWLLIFRAHVITSTATSRIVLFTRNQCGRMLGSWWKFVRYINTQGDLSGRDAVRNTRDVTPFYRRQYFRRKLNSYYNIVT